MTGPTRGTTGEDSTFDYGAVTRSGRPFQVSSSSFHLHTVVAPQPHPTGAGWFGLIPFRSPLLGKSHLLSFPTVTEMFQFTALAPYAYRFNVR